MRQIVFDDFSGGIAGEALSFETSQLLTDGYVTPRQVRDAHGLVLDDQRRLRSQPSVDRWGTLANATDIVSFTASTGDYLIARRSDGTFWYHFLGTHGSTSTIAATHAFSSLYTWTQITGPSHVDLRLVGGIRWKRSNEFEPGFIIAKPASAGSTDLAASYVAYESGTGVLSVSTLTSFYPSLTGSPPEPASGSLPRANFATMWRDFAVLAGIRWSSANAETGLTSNNTRAYNNYLWLSDPLDPTKYDPRYPVRAAEEGSRIIACFAVEEGLLVFSTRAGGYSGITLLRGNPAEFVSSEPSGTFELVGEYDVADEGSIWYWDEQQSIVFVTRDNRLWQYRQGRVWDISPYGATVGAQNNPLGGFVATAGRFLLYYDARTKYIWALRSFGEEGGWTRLNLTGAFPLGGAFAEARGDLFYVTETGTVMRVRVTTQQTSGASTRGCVNGALVDLTVVTQPAGRQDQFSEKWWDKVGVVLRSGAMASGFSPLLVLVKQNGTAWDDTSADVTDTLNATPNGRHVVPGLGDSPVNAVSVVVRGDVIVEQVVLWWNQGSERW